MNRWLDAARWVWLYNNQLESSFLSLRTRCSFGFFWRAPIFFGVYLVVLLAVLRQMVVYLDLLREIGFYGSLLRATKMVRISTGTHSAQCYHSGWKSLRSMRGSYASECAEAASCGPV